jgi:hypothetical protein
MRLLAVSLLVAAGLQGALAQEKVAVALEGWNASERNGVTYFRCASSICANGSVLSYKEQPHRPALTLGEFERHQLGLAESNRNSGGRIKDVRVYGPKESTIQGVKIFSIQREVHWANGSVTHTVDARMTGPRRDFSLVSDSPRMEWTVNTYQGFLPRVVDLALLSGPSP